MAAKKADPRESANLFASVNLKMGGLAGVLAAHFFLLAPLSAQAARPAAKQSSKSQDKGKRRSYCVCKFRYMNGGQPQVQESVTLCRSPKSTCKGEFALDVEGFVGASLNCGRGDYQEIWGLESNFSYTQKPSCKKELRYEPIRD